MGNISSPNIIRASDINDLTINSLKVNELYAGATSKIKISEDNESGCIDIFNNNKGSDAIFWHIDAFDNKLRFVRDGQTTPSWIDSSGLHGVSFDISTLYSGYTGNHNTITFSDNKSLSDFTMVTTFAKSSEGIYLSSPWIPGGNFSEYFTNIYYCCSHNNSIWKFFYKTGGTQMYIDDSSMTWFWVIGITF